MKRYQIFWKDNDRPVSDCDVTGVDDLVPGFIRLHCVDGVRLINRDEVRMIVVKESL